LVRINLLYKSKMDENNLKTGVVGAKKNKIGIP
jgi:hypothetical protein